METTSLLPKRVLCIASHVVHGYVGNRAAVFPLQVLGFEVDVINSCQLSNHTGYPSFKGDFLSGAQLDNLVNGLQSNHLLDYDYVLTGYIRNQDFLASVIRLVDLIKLNRPSVRYICDPVLGDHGKVMTFFLSSNLVLVFYVLSTFHSPFTTLHSPLPVHQSHQ